MKAALLHSNQSLNAVELVLRTIMGTVVLGKQATNLDPSISMKWIKFTIYTRTYQIQVDGSTGLQPLWKHRACIIYCSLFIAEHSCLNPYWDLEVAAFLRSGSKKALWYNLLSTSPLLWRAIGFVPWNRRRRNGMWMIIKVTGCRVSLYFMSTNFTSGGRTHIICTYTYYT